jgi:hypothetical protein
MATENVLTKSDILQNLKIKNQTSQLNNSIETAIHQVSFHSCQRSEENSWQQKDSTIIHRVNESSIEFRVN